MITSNKFDLVNIKSYPLYKETDLPWLGKIPSHWAIRRGKWLFRNNKEINIDNKYTNILSLTLRGVVNNNPDNPEGLVPKDYGTYQFFRKGDLVFKLIDLENLRTSRVGFVHKDGIMSSAYIRLIPIHNGIQKFFFLQYYDLYQRGIYNQLGAGVRSTLGPNDLLNICILVPTLDEQNTIVRFLDHADKRIKRYIRAKQKLIKLLNEQMQAIIHQAVTRGLDPNVRLKPSGVEWLGDVPMHWEVMRIKQLAKIQRGKFTHRPRNDPSFYDGPYPFIQTGDVARANKRITEYKQTLNEKGLTVSKMFPKGTLLMTIAANIGDVAVLDFEACFPDSIVGFIPNENVYRDFLYLIFCAMKNEFLHEAPVNTQGNLNVDRVGVQKIICPPLKEQLDIITYVETEMAQLNIGIERTNNEISLLREYLIRLIAEVVTGKLDVRTVVAQLPEEAEEVEATGDEVYLIDDENEQDDLELEAEEDEP